MQVGAGDSAAVLAQRYGVPENVLLQTNNLHSAAEVRPGTTIVIPIYNAVASAPGAARVAAGGQHTCAINVAGRLYCWGANADGQLGVGAAGAPRPTPQPVPLPGRALAVNTMGQTPGGRLTLTTPDGAERAVSFAAEDRSPFLAQVEAFGDALLAGRAFPVPPARDLHTMRLLDACARETMADVPFDADAGPWHAPAPHPVLPTPPRDAAPALRL